MTPTLNGRIQTRVFLLLVVGIPWTLFITPLLPAGGPPDDPFSALLRTDLEAMYEVTFTALGIVLVFGLGWELVYHGLQQFRWEKDWPALFGLLTGINEGIVAWFGLEAALADDLAVTGTQFVIVFVPLWILIWLIANGPMRVVFIRWRFRGGRII